MVFLTWEAIMNWDGEERRYFVRVKFPCEITVKGSRKHAISSHTENISAGGLRVILGERLPSGAEVDIDIYGIKSTPFICKGRIAWVFERKMFFSKGAFGFDTGIEFSDLNAKDVAVLKEFISSVSKKK